MQKLTNKTQSTSGRNKTLTSYTKTPFKMSIERVFERGYCLKSLEKSHMKKLNEFIKRTVGNDLSFKEVQENYGRRPDKTDTIDGYEVVHYQVDRKFRLHGIIRDASFVICRIDPNHKFHN